MNKVETPSAQVTLETNDVGPFNVTGIVSVTFTADQGFIDTVQLLQKLCLENDLTQARRWFNAEQWSDGEGAATEEAVEGECLVVTAESFWLRCCIDDYTFVESREVEIAGFLEKHPPHEAVLSDSDPT